jgi:uncharacterized small protein (DUF1192 family)
MQAATVAILIEKAAFEPNKAVAVAEAIDVAIAGAEWVTVAVLDARLSELKAEIKEVKAELVRWVFVVMLGNVALGAAATALVNALQHAH